MTRYELTERIGAGAMAEIFRGKAVASGGFEKPVAIKRILPHLSQDERFVEILIAEANIVSHLRHRNIVQVFDVGLGPDGQYFVVMELVDGCNLGALQTGLETRQKRLPIGLGLYIGAEICDALEHAHRAPGPDGRSLRLVHRDVSPNNVLLSRSGEVKLTDFGIAKRSEEVSLHGGVRGKFAYISPEQGSGRAVDARSDVFSVGILLFEMITGRRLFSGLPDFEALKAVCEGKVPRPRLVDPKIDPKLEAILLKALAHEAEERYPGAGELGKDLRAYRYSLPSTGGDPAAELATLVTRLSGRQQPAKRESPAAVPRPKPDDFTGGTNTFTLEEEASLVRKTTYEEAWQKFREEETRVARSYQAASESGSMPSATMLGHSPMGAAHGDHDGDVSEEATRIVDPYLRASSRAGKDDDEGIPGRMDSVSESTTQPVAAPPMPRPMSQPMARQSAARPPSGALPLTAARMPGSAAVLDDVEGVPPETLELHGAQAMAMVDAVEAVVAAHEAARASMARPAVAADPSAVIRVAAVPAGDPSLRKGFPRWAVILFVVLLVGIILAGFFLGDGGSGEATTSPAQGDPAAAGQAPAEAPAQPSAKPTETATAGLGSAAATPGPEATEPAAEPAAEPAIGPAAATDTEPTAATGTAIAAATPGTADAGPTAARTSDRVQSRPTRPRTDEKSRSAATEKSRSATTEKSRSASTEKSRSASTEKSRSAATEKSRSAATEKSRSAATEKSRSAATRKARHKDKERQKRRRDRNR